VPSPGPQYARIVDRWLSDDQQAAWRRLAAVIMRLPAALDTQLHSESGLSHFEYLVLALLSEAGPERALRSSVLAERCNVSLSRLSHGLTRMEQRGWVTRRHDPDDGRVSVAVLTDAGHAKLTEAAPGHVETVRALVFDHLSDRQVQSLRALCDALLDDA
jgi:DNA-binding MarR family transcriptional regulator